MLLVIKFLKSFSFHHFVGSSNFINISCHVVYSSFTRNFVHLCNSFLFSVPFCNFLQGTYICFLGTIEKTVIMHILGIPDICICFAFLQNLEKQYD